MTDTTTSQTVVRPCHVNVPQHDLDELRRRITGDDAGARTVLDNRVRQAQM